MTARGRGGLLRPIAAGLAAFAVGAALALALLPEWRTGPVPPARTFEDRFRQVAAAAGLAPLPGKPEAELTAPNVLLTESYLALGAGAPRWLEAERAGLLVSASRRLQPAGGTESLEVALSLAGRAMRIEWSDLGVPVFSQVDRAAFRRLALRLAAAALAPGERLGAFRETAIAGPSWEARVDVLGSSPPQHLQVTASPPQLVSVRRLPGLADGARRPVTGELWRGFLRLLFYLALAAIVGALFLVLLLRGRIGLVNGALLGLATLASADLRPFFESSAGWWFLLLNALAAAPGRALMVFLVWSAGESLLRTLDPDFTTSLDTLRVGRLGPRGGRALLLGFGFGALLAGARLALPAVAAHLPVLAPAAASVRVPVFDADGSPVGSGIWLAAAVALASALALRFAPRRAWGAAAALLAGYVVSPLPLSPFPVELAANAAFAGALVWICRRHGLTALLTASVVSLLLPAALVSVLHFDWMPGSAAATVTLTALVAVAGVVGLSRAEGVETGDLPTPAFMRRLTQERRLRHEMDLLVRMQTGLLPAEMPRVPGWEVAARSVLASEAGGDLYDFLRDGAGGLWIAEGDVAGHGYSCAIALAMIKAGLVSLVEPGESPGNVLRQLDRMLRSAAAEAGFTSLALARLDPETGEGVLANAGHPYPLVFAGGRVTEIELPGLPLGRGPARTYADRPFALPSGGVLLLCSDGLFEALDRDGRAYGFDRVREVLSAMGHRPPVEIVDALLNDCRRHLGAERPPDDVTVVVVKRM